MTKPRKPLWKKVITIPDEEYELTLQSRNMGGRKEYSLIVLHKKKKTMIQTRISATPEEAAINAYRSMK